jgi:hypothetical protein
VEIGAVADLDMDELLGVHSRVVTFVLQTLIEQAVPLLERLLMSQGRMLSPAVVQLPEHLRFGVPTTAARALAARGLRHRRAAVELGNALNGHAPSEERAVLFPIVRQVIEDDRNEWRTRLGTLVFDRTLQDLL